MAKAVALVVAVVALVAMMMSAADGCDPGPLAACLPSFTNGEKPTAECCTNLNAQQGCLCQYARDPAYSKYVQGRNARNTLMSCGMAIPSC